MDDRGDEAEDQGGDAGRRSIHPLQERLEKVEEDITAVREAVEGLRADLDSQGRSSLDVARALAKLQMMHFFLWGTSALNSQIQGNTDQSEVARVNDCIRYMREKLHAVRRADVNLYRADPSG